MDLREYFEGARGLGVLATADDQGRVDVAVYASPHVMDDTTIAFIMPDRLTHRNLQSNAHAAYLFKEDGPGYKGIRLFLKKLREEQDSELLHSIRRKKYASEKGEEETSRYLVFFTVEQTLPLIGAGKNL
ncbi:MAG TPA: pyridoxamine 5'-phosphate oxidase family protein [Desulfatiglandales bacterium]|nr:pyridoxamine 5'-phosphate oxidase family protein [Desulfatiglandales bacterium]